MGRPWGVMSIRSLALLISATRAFVLKNAGPVQFVWRIQQSGGVKFDDISGLKPRIHDAQDQSRRIHVVLFTSSLDTDDHRIASAQVFRGDDRPRHRQIFSPENDRVSHDTFYDDPCVTVVREG